MTELAMGYVDEAYLQTAAEAARRVGELSYERMRVEPGQAVLDVGCGPGLGTAALAPLVRPAGGVVGIDHDPTMIAEAERRARQAGIHGWVTHRVADAYSLPFESSSFDGCRSERLFQHLAHPEYVLAEMVRVTKPGGFVVIVDTDWATLSIDTDEQEIERRLARFKAEETIRNGYSGRQLYRQCRRQRLEQISVDLVANHVTSYEMAKYLLLLGDVEDLAVKAGALDREELRRWHTSLEEADRQGVFFASLVIYVVAGRKPLGLDE